MAVFLSAGHVPGAKSVIGGIEEGRFGVDIVDAIASVSEGDYFVVPHSLDLGPAEKWVRSRSAKDDIMIEFHLDYNPKSSGAFCLYHKDIPHGKDVAQRLAKLCSDAFGVPVKDGGPFEKGAIERLVVARWSGWDDMGWFRYYGKGQAAMPYLIECATLPSDANKITGAAIGKLAIALAEFLIIKKPIPNQWKYRDLQWLKDEGFLTSGEWFDQAEELDQPFPRWAEATILRRMYERLKGGE